MQITKQKGSFPNTTEYKLSTTHTLIRVLSDLQLEGQCDMEKYTCTELVYQYKRELLHQLVGNPLEDLHHLHNLILSEVADRDNLLEIQSIFTKLNEMLSIPRDQVYTIKEK